MCRFCYVGKSKEALSVACAYKNEEKVPWYDSTRLEYKESNLLQPKDIVPVVAAGSHFQHSEERILVPMVWGMIPPWQKGDYSQHNATTHNARIENIEEGKIYPVPLKEGKRCIIVFQAFWEKKKGNARSNNSDQPFYFYEESKDLLRAAGLFSKFKTQEGDIIYSVTMMTQESPSSIRPIHHRSPIFLWNDKQVEEWLDYKNHSANTAIDTLRSMTFENKLVYYQVTEIGSNEKKSTRGQATSASRHFFNQWLKKAPKRKLED